ncbi:response regulator transcription factor [Frankia sp. AgB32]|uniref:response regulator transcription factor n=1 Tax=Frankia sp. AgB32 TaxID=631119 RepID=UPI00200DD898|nr:response regulator transcription factor [Frankia sp. AgB32]
MDAHTIRPGRGEAVGSAGGAPLPEPDAGPGWRGAAEIGLAAVAPLAGPASGPELSGGRPVDVANTRDGVGVAGSRSAPPPRRVVVVDDADGVRDLLCLLLGAEPDFVIVGAASNGVEAIEEVVRTAPDLVLLDLAMPVLDGIGALPRIRRAVPQAVVVIFTGFSEEVLLDRVLSLGADALLEKGLATGPLVDQLRKLCASPRLA